MSGFIKTSMSAEQNNQSNILTVSQINFYLKSLLKEDYRLKNLLIKGEISTLKIHSSGHIYFSLKDDVSIIKAVMFAANAKNLPFTPVQGMKVVIQGYIDVYERDGIYQFYCNDILQSGFGNQALALVQLKQKLFDKGVFDENHKKQIPFLPKKIGVIAGDESAALYDILTVLKNQYPICEVVVFPVPVQGQDADKFIAFAVEFLDKNNLCDVIICSRGGGSKEDLSAFNSEILAQYVFACKTPVISAVGHEIDVTILDLVADLRAQTPTAGANIFASNLQNYNKNLHIMQNKINELINLKITLKSQMLQKQRSRQVFSSYENILDNAQISNTNKFKKIINTITKKCDFNKYIIDIQKEKMYNHTNEKINFALSKNEKHRARIDNLVSKNITKSSFVVKNKIDQLNALNPLNILKRGYSAVFRQGDNPDQSTAIKTAKIGDNVTIITYCKKITAQIKNIDDNKIL